MCTNTLPARAFPKWTTPYSGLLNSRLATRSPGPTPAEISRFAKRFASRSYSPKSNRRSPAMTAVFRGVRRAASRRISPSVKKLSPGSDGSHAPVFREPAHALHGLEDALHPRAEDVAGQDVDDSLAAFRMGLEEVREVEVAVVEGVHQFAKGAHSRKELAGEGSERGAREVRPWSDNDKLCRPPALRT